MGLGRICYANNWFHNLVTLSLLSLSFDLDQKICLVPCKSLLWSKSSGCFHHWNFEWVFIFIEDKIIAFYVTFGGMRWSMRASLKIFLFPLTGVRSGIDVFIVSLKILKLKYMNKYPSGDLSFFQHLCTVFWRGKTNPFQKFPGWAGHA